MVHGEHGEQLSLHCILHGTLERWYGDEKQPALASRFTGHLDTLVTGKPEEAALGLNRLMKVDDAYVDAARAEGVQAIVREFERHGTEEDLECLDYVLHAQAGSSELTFQNGRRRDTGRNGERLADFVAHTNAQTACLGEAHVLALRLWTTACYKSLVEPLRVGSRTARPAHPFPVTISLIKEGISRLRACAAGSDQKHDHNHEHVDANGPACVDLWRGLRNVVVPADFACHGGCELTPMSTSSSLATALSYAQSGSSLLLKLRTHSFLQRGVSLEFLTAFPGEEEFLFPPLTCLTPTGRRMVVTKGSVTITVVEVEPIMA